MRTRTLLMAAATLTVLAISAPARAQIQVLIPGDIQPPIYADLDRGFQPHTDEWAAIRLDRSRTSTSTPAGPGCINATRPPSGATRTARIPPNGDL